MILPFLLGSKFSTNVLKMKSEISSSELQNFERDPDAALLSLALNTGLNRYSLVRTLFGNGNTIKENDVHVKAAMESLIRDIEKDHDKSELGRIVEEFQRSISPCSKLLSCASCGVRSFCNDSDNFSATELRKLRTLKMSDSEKAILENIPLEFRPAVSYYVSRVDGDFYHLHPELISVKENGVGKMIEESAILCLSCKAVAARKNRPGIPPFSIAAGMDYGVPSRINLPPLRLVEQYVIARVRLYSSIIKLPGTSATLRHSAKKGHVISFPQPESPELVAEKARLHDSGDLQSYPRIDGLKRLITVAFIGAKSEFAALEPSRLSAVVELQVNLFINLFHIL